MYLEARFIYIILHHFYASFSQLLSMLVTYLMSKHTKHQVNIFFNMRYIAMFVSTVCALFLTLSSTTLSSFV